MPLSWPLWLYPAQKLGTVCWLQERHQAAPWPDSAASSWFLNWWLKPEFSCDYHPILTTEVSIPWSSWAGVFRGLSLHSPPTLTARWTISLDRGVVPAENVHHQDWGDLDTGHLLCVRRGPCVEQRSTFARPFAFAAAVIRKMRGQHFLPTKNTGSSRLHQHEAGSSQECCCHCHKLLWATSFATVLSANEMRKISLSLYSYFSKKGKWPGLVSPLTVFTTLTTGCFQKSNSLFQENGGHHGEHSKAAKEVKAIPEEELLSVLGSDSERFGTDVY